MNSDQIISIEICREKVFIWNGNLGLPLESRSIVQSEVENDFHLHHNVSNTWIVGGIIAVGKSAELSKDCGRPSNRIWIIVASSIQ